MTETQNWPEILAEKDQKIAALEQQNQWLLEQLRLVKHRQFGPSSEQMQLDQLSLFNEGEQLADERVATKEVKAHTRRAAGKIGLDKLPDDLPVEVIEHDLPADQRSCPDCGGEMHAMGRETRDELKFVPARAVIVRHVRHAYACRCCEKCSDHVPIVKAPMPAPVIKGSFASPEAIAHIAYEKFVMGSPLYRQEQDWARKGIPLGRQTMANWLIRATQDWLFPVYDVLRTKLLMHQVLHADETGLQVLREPGKTPQSKSFMWLYRTSGEAKHAIVLYEYQPGRHARYPKDFLRDFAGYLHADGYEGYRDLPQSISVVGCWAHVRRKFDEALKIIPKSAQTISPPMEAMRRIGELYKLEEKFQELSQQDNFKARFEARQQHSRPLIDTFFDWSKAQNALPKSHFGRAVNYALNQRFWLEKFLLDGRLEIDNNRAERSIKPFVIGRKNWLFCNTQGGAKTSAVLYSIIETCKENGVNPFDYLAFAFRNAPNLDLVNNP